MILTVYGSEGPCASCAQIPSSRATAEWLQAALSRKFGSGIRIRYIPISHPETEQDRQFCMTTDTETFFYPLLVSDGQVIGEGIIQLKPIIRYIEKWGIKPVNSLSVDDNKEQ